MVIRSVWLFLLTVNFFYFNVQTIQFFPITNKFKRQIRNDFFQERQNINYQQHKLSLLRNNITLGLNIPYDEEGNWSEWTEPSECSRPCGGGVAKQTRVCLDNNRCKGPSVKYFSCNFQDCDPREIDFRQQQCARYDSVPYKEKYYNWIPYTQGKNPCELNCMPRGNQFFIKHANKVIDGTKCYEDGSLDVCVDGQCMPVGCDNLLGSTLKEDKCKVCGGDGSSCHVIYGVYESDSNLKTGYNDLFTIPTGATNIKIKEVIPTSNFIAVRSNKGNFYLNGNWKIDLPKAMKFAGSVFNYVRVMHATHGEESLTSAGPIIEPLIIVLLYQEKNRGIVYQYSIEKKPEEINLLNKTMTNLENENVIKYYDNLQVRNNNYRNFFHWWPAEWSKCSKNCNSGLQQRRVLCLKLKNLNSLREASNHLPSDSEIVPEQYCDILRKPASQQTCNDHVCPPVWQIGVWSKCICKLNIKIRSVVCKKGILHPESNRPIQEIFTLAEDDECTAARKLNKPHSIEKCDDMLDCENITLTILTNLKNDNTTCLSKDNEKSCELNEKKTKELDDLIDGLNLIQPLRNCSIKHSYGWLVGNWSKCDSRCGEGSQNRTVSCVEIDPNIGISSAKNHTLPDVFCINIKKPEQQKKCNEIPCTGVDWIVTSFSKCENEKLEINDTNDEVLIENNETLINAEEFEKDKIILPFVKTREVFCATKDGQIYDDNWCNLKKKPKNVENCLRVQQTPQWFTSEWSSCSVRKCGLGFKTRFVFCAIINQELNQTFEITTNDNCNIKNKPIEQKLCSGEKENCETLNLFTPWSKCSCNLEQTRSLICLKKDEKSNSYVLNNCTKNENEYDLKQSCEEELTDVDYIDTKNKCNITEESEPDCEKSKFGCCPNLDIPAEGNNFKGCKFDIIETCESSTFGCCRNKQYAAFGPFQYGCVLNCFETKFGCCQDNLTIATNINFEGCENYTFCKSNKNETNCQNASINKENLNQFDKNIKEDSVLEGSGDDLEGSGYKTEIDEQRITKNCSETEFGCCQDNFTIKLDADGTGCEFLEKKFEDNPNNITVVTDQTNDTYNLILIEKKCLSSEFGCCFDGITAATGENQLGCNCSLSPYGCCLDGITPAIGLNFEGCNNCNKSKYGCCYDGKTAAKGYIGDTKVLNCPCDSTKYGCCPDHITTAIGPDFTGCPCDSKAHGCCPDDKTAATGPRYEGCNCETSPHGCCNDKKTVAFGPNKQGCPDAPTLDVQHSSLSCFLPRERGSCRNFTVKWYFDQAYGGCSRFWYGGCEGNANRFISQDECERICMKPLGPEACQLPMVKGPCENDKVVWGYNNLKYVCQQFTYGGCLGNQNRFETRETCEQTCFYSENNDPCEQPLSPGQCLGFHQRYYYNKITNRCEPFVYTGCQGNNNNFVTEYECRNRCTARTAREICVLPVATGSCLGKYPRYYFDYQAGICREFIFSGCDGNNNQFVDRKSCEQLCNNTKIFVPKYPVPYEIPSFTTSINNKTNLPSRTSIDATLATLQIICNANKEPGNCNDSIIKWYYNPIQKQCESFYYSGCGGNNNQFESKYDCQQRCLVQLPKYLLHQQQELLRQHQILLQQQKLKQQQQQQNNQTQQNVCLQNRESGNCFNFVERWYYDQDDKHCYRFYYSGCNGNGNNFYTERDCILRCAYQTEISISNEASSHSSVLTKNKNNLFKTEDCFLKPEHGPCNNEEPKWYYDSTNGLCKQFYYGGCEGNNNRFQSSRECQTKCWNSQNVCLLIKIKGPCHGNFSQWYFDKEENECKEFIYGGCQGNANRFSSKESCKARCKNEINNYDQINSIEADSKNLNKKASDKCQLKVDLGNCRQYLERFYFDSYDNSCKQFIYTGCGGNANRFIRRDDCERQCVDKKRLDDREPDESENKNVICNLPRETGHCHESHARWYYDPSSFTCLSFVYGGCAGNLNRFKTFDNCYKFCNGIKSKHDNLEDNSHLISTTFSSILSTENSDFYRSTTMPNLNQTQPIQPVNCPIEKCDQKCHFGEDNYLDEKGCPHCRCSHPCYVYKCPEGQRCAIEVFRTDSKQFRAQPVCRLLNKPGECPDSQLNTSSNKDCIDRCRVDADCRGIDKCCNNGCANVCLPALGVINNLLEENSITSKKANFEHKINYENENKNEKLFIKVRLQEPVILNCGYTPNQQQVAVAWNKDNLPLIKIISSQNNRIEILNNGSLLIKDARVEDNGEYSCSYANRETSQLITKYRILQVFLPARISPGPKQVIAQQNQPAVLECNANGIPKPIVTWWKDNKMLPIYSSKYVQNTENYHLTVNNVDQNDFGVYYCQATNNFGPMVVWDVTLLLDFELHLNKPLFTHLREEKDNNKNINTFIYNHKTTSENRVEDETNNIAQTHIKAKLLTEVYKTGSNLKIECLTNGYPMPVVWYFNNEQIQESELLNKLRRRNPLNSVITNMNGTLIINKLLKQHSGVYTCRSINSDHQASSNVTIDVQDIAIPPTCVDSPYYLNCDIITTLRYCNNKTYFKYCCRTCLLSNQITFEEAYSQINN